MNNGVKDIDIKNHIHHFFKDMINIKTFDPNRIKIDEKLCKKYSYLLYRIRNKKSFEICKN